MRLDRLEPGHAVLAVLLWACVVVAGCSGLLARGEGIDPLTLPENVRADYDVFAQRCSKCHSLARPLSSGIDDDDYWAMYVAKMRRQPGSGISQEDTVVILRFLHYFSAELQKKRAGSRQDKPLSVAPVIRGKDRPCHGPFCRIVAEDPLVPTLRALGRRASYLTRSG
jgi:hypothetical protein